jgi:hypothetical protein
MKKWNVIYWIFLCLFFIAWTYLDFYVKLDSLYWLVGKLTGFVLLILGQILIIIRKKEESKATIFFRICFGIFLVSFWGYREIAKYKSDICDDKFGREFNARRRRLSTPEIPADWHVKDKGRGYVEWEAKDTIGHTRKRINIDSSCTIMYEYDEYKLEPVKGKIRSISIETRYLTRKGIDPVSYLYEPGIDTSRYITQQQADSIFAAEKIKKDY